MWEIDATQVINLRSDTGGWAFTRFVDHLIEAELFYHGVPFASLWTNRRVNLADGGVDTAVLEPIPSSQSGFFAFPTCWQYKASKWTDMGDSKIRSIIREEVGKPYSKQLIGMGYGCRFCVCDSLPAPKRRQWENLIQVEVEKICKEAAPAKLIDADDLARWANDLPAVIMQFHGSHVGDFLHLTTWGQSITSHTPVYVNYQSATDAQGRIADHADFSRGCHSAVQLMRGDPGVGKSRLAYEALNAIPGAQHYTCYVEDEDRAVKFAYSATNSGKRAFLVADECSLKTYERLDRLLQGHADRLRVLCINVSERPHGTGEPDVLLAQPPDVTVKEILKTNFSHVPEERRSQYAGLAKGFVRFAVDMCREDAKIEAQGLGVLSSPDRYLEVRLDDSHKKVLAALGLFSKVGFKRDVASELDAMCVYLGLGDRDKVLEIARDIKAGPGFVSEGGRYAYVTPEIIAGAAFRMGWERWFVHDPAERLNAMPGSLLPSFLKRVSKSAGEEVGRLVGDFFRNWAAGLTAEDLAVNANTLPMVMLVQATPEDYLPTLRLVVENGAIDVVRSVGGSAADGWGPRRHIVWTLERLAWFPEYFQDAEAILFRLALAESEPRIGNNATSIWKQLFRIYLSGTSVPFQDRILLLETRMMSGDESVIGLASEALDGILQGRASRMDTRSVIADRVTPLEWKPATNRELADCLRSVLSLLSRMMNVEPEMLRDAALTVLISKVSRLLEWGFLDEVKDLLAEIQPDDGQLSSLIQELDGFVSAHREDEGDFDDTYLQQVMNLQEGLAGKSLHTRLIRVVGKSPWERSLFGSEDAWANELATLVERLYGNQNELEAELPWLMSEEARSKDIVGRELGRLDYDVRLLDILIERSVSASSSGLCANYIHGLLQHHPRHVERVNHRIDEIEEVSPRTAYELFMAGGAITRDVARLQRLVDMDLLPVEYLRGILFYSRQKALSIETFSVFLGQLLAAVREGNQRAAGIAVEALAYRLDDAAPDVKMAVLTDPLITELIWNLLEITANDGGGEDIWWFRVLTDVAECLDSERSMRLATVALLSENLSVRERAEKFLIASAHRFPREIMTHLGNRIMDEQIGWRFFVDEFKDLFNAIPAEVVVVWLNLYGVEGARKLARHLPVPFINREGVCVVPELTAQVLTTYQDDDRVFREFLAGCHSFQMYGGDIAAQHKKEADLARQFLNHPLRRIREWAQHEVETAEQNAAREAEWAEEAWLE